MTAAYRSSSLKNGVVQTSSDKASASDTSAPTLLSSTPADDTIAVAVGKNIVLTFSEAVTAGSGKIVISNGVDDTRTIDVTDTSQVIISGSTVKINPTANLNPNSTYNVQMASGVIKDLAGNAYAGINKATTLNFSTQDTLAPTLVSSNPEDNATAVAVGKNIVLTFSEAVRVGSGNIVISNGAGDTRTIDVTDTSQVTVSGNTVKIDPTENLKSNSSYNVQMASGVLTDLAGNAYAGISKPATLNFSTLDTIAPTLLSSTPADDATAVGTGKNIVLTFSEAVMAGSGNIVISNGVDDTRIINVADASQVTVSGNTVKINPAANLHNNSTYNVQMASGVLTDLAGNAYAGINKPATLNFSTPDTLAPTLVSSNPADNASAVGAGKNIVLTFSESVRAGSGNIVISNGADDTRTIDVTDASQVTVSGNTVKINPTANLHNNSTYNVQMAGGVIKDLAGNAYAGINKPATLNFSTLDTIAPTLLSSTPADNATAVGTSKNIVLTFSEAVMVGSGKIVISNGAGDTRTIDVADASQVTVSGNTVKINPTENLKPNSSYNVQMAGGVIKDLAGNAYAGINQPTTLNFSTPDTLAPTLVSSSPEDNATAVAVGKNIVLTFSEAVAAGSGNIVISNGADTRTIPVTDASQVAISGKTVTINPVANLNPASTYNVQMASGVFTDLAGNAYAGIGKPATLNFSTVDPLAPTLVSSSPADDATAVAVGKNIVLTFSEAVAAGTGNIVISNGASDTRTINVTDASQVTISGNTVTINPAANLKSNNTYNVQMASGVIKDTAGNAYAGINKPTTLNFSTPDTIAPTLAGSTPADDAKGVAVDKNIVLTFSEAVAAGSGNIVIDNGHGDTRIIAVTDASQVSISGNAVTINPAANLKTNSTYNVQMAGGVLTDLAGNAYAGINDANTLNFSTPDTIAPTLSGSVPADNATAVAVDKNIVLTFSEAVKAGSGSIVISNGVDDTRTMGVNDASQVSISGNTVTINPAANLKPNSSYNVQMANGVIKDLAGNAYAGISDVATLNFSTPDTIVPTLLSSVPADNATAVAVGKNIVLTFSETVVAGSGSIVISNGAGDNRSIDVADTSQVIISGNTVKINPTLDLKPNNSYHLQIASGVLTDLAGNAYAGLSDAEALNFSTAPSASAINLSSLDGGNGFRLDGVKASDLSGLSVSSAGDVNGDGFDDLIVGAPWADPNDNWGAGSSYVIFGQALGTASSIGLDALDGTTGFRLDGDAAGGRAGYSVSAAGDVNGDGFDDLIVGAAGASPNGDLYAGSSYVVFGQASGFASSVDLGLLDGTAGFRLDGVTTYDGAGTSVDSAGDVNGDGFDDLIVGAPWAGSSYVVFGKASGFASSINLSTLDGVTGFRLDGEAPGDQAGFVVASAGDVNGDGLGDLLIGAPGADHSGSRGNGAGYVVFGQSSGFASSMNLSSLDGVNGFRLAGDAGGDRAGYSASSAGDVNGDGFDDLIVGAPWSSPDSGHYAGSSYVVFGRAAGFSSSLDLSALDGTNGFRLDGVAGYDSAGWVSAAGDFNGDGFDDLLVGSPSADPNGLDSAGSCYVLFGQASGFASSINLSTLDGVAGFRLDGAAAGYLTGSSVSAAGDVNGDGFDDLIVGAPEAGPSGGNRAGYSYVVFGSDFTGAVTYLGAGGADTLSGSSAAESFVSGNGNDSMVGGGGADAFHGGRGSDTITVSDLSFRLVDGGGGSDTLALSKKGLDLDLSAYRGKIESIETIDLTGTGNNSLGLSALDVLNLSGSGTPLTIDGDAGDTVYGLASGWTDGGLSGAYHSYTQGQAMVLVGVNITTDYPAA